jgi:glutamine synthetase type III
MLQDDSHSIDENEYGNGTKKVSSNSDTNDAISTATDDVNSLIDDLVAKNNKHDDSNTHVRLLYTIDTS